MIESNIVMILLAWVGIIISQLYGWYETKEENPEEEFNFRYVYAMIIAAIPVGLTFSMFDGPVTIYWIFVAIATGMGMKEIVIDVAKVVGLPPEE